MAGLITSVQQQLEGNEQQEASETGQMLLGKLNRSQFAPSHRHDAALPNQIIRSPTSTRIPPPVSAAQQARVMPEETVNPQPAAQLVTQKASKQEAAPDVEAANLRSDPAGKGGERLEHVLESPQKPAPQPSLDELRQKAVAAAEKHRAAKEAEKTILKKPGSLPLASKASGQSSDLSADAAKAGDSSRQETAAPYVSTSNRTEDQRAASPEDGQGMRTMSRPSGQGHKKDGTGPGNVAKEVTSKRDEMPSSGRPMAERAYRDRKAAASREGRHVSEGRDRRGPEGQTSSPPSKRQRNESSVPVDALPMLPDLHLPAIVPEKSSPLQRRTETEKRTERSRRPEYSRSRSRRRSPSSPRYSQRRSPDSPYKSHRRRRPDSDPRSRRRRSKSRSPEYWRRRAASHRDVSPDGVTRAKRARRGSPPSPLVRRRGDPGARIESGKAAASLPPARPAPHLA